jgi:hypothetical protein
MNNLIQPLLTKNVALGEVSVMVSWENKDLESVERFHIYLMKPDITLADLEELLLIAQEIHTLELHYRDNRKYIEAFIHNEFERNGGASKKNPKPVFVAQIS